MLIALLLSMLFAAPTPERVRERIIEERNVQPGQPAADLPWMQRVRAGTEPK